MSAADVTPEDIDQRIAEARANADQPWNTGYRVLVALADERDRLRSELASMNKLVSNVPDLVKSAFQEGFAGNSGGLGEAWENSRARKVLDGDAFPRPPSWDADKHRIAVLEAELASRPVAVEVPEWIRVEDRLPDDLQCVAYLSPYGGLYQSATALFHAGHHAIGLGGFGTCRRVTHWYPLPTWPGDALRSDGGATESSDPANQGRE